MNQYTQPLREERFYHIYNQGNNGDNIFHSKENYEHFIRKFDSYLSDFVNIYCYCLLPNHFHFIIQIKEWNEFQPYLINYIGLEKMVENTDEKVEAVISEMFRRFFMSYSKAFNRQQERTGSLFRKYFKRKLIDSTEYLQNSIIYIHRNPKHHGIDNNFENYPWSSFSKIMDGQESKLKKEEVLGLFDDIENYKFNHQRDIDLEME